MNMAHYILTFTFLVFSPFSFAHQAKPTSKSEENVSAFMFAVTKTGMDHILIKACDFPIEGTGFYRHKAWLAINPNKQKTASTQVKFNFQEGNYDLIFSGVGEYDGESVYELSVNSQQVMYTNVPLSEFSYEEGIGYSGLVENVQLKPGDQLKVTATVGTDGAEFSRARWGGIILVDAGKGKQLMKKLKNKGTTETIKK
jgi:hypothetical protein